MKDEELIRLVAARDEEAFLELYRRYRQRIFNYALHKRVTPEEAEEITQDVMFYAIWQSAHQFDEARKTSFRTWCFKCAWNRTINEIKYWKLDRHRALRLKDRVSEDVLLTYYASDGVEYMDANIFVDEVIRATRTKLTPEERSMLEVLMNERPTQRRGEDTRAEDIIRKNLRRKMQNMFHRYFRQGATGQLEGLFDKANRSGI
jgi:DNA-directed RNA polymerase specialized sigma24 family protein